MGTKHIILSIDAWAEGKNNWSWNNWYKKGVVELPDVVGNPQDNPVIWDLFKKYYRCDKHSYYIDGDGHNYVLTQKKDYMPVAAIEYGYEYEELE